MAAHLGHAPVVAEHHHLVGGGDRLELVGDDHERRGAPQLLDGGDDIGLVLRVQGAGGLVEQDDRGALEQGADDEFDNY